MLQPTRGSFIKFKAEGVTYKQRSEYKTGSDMFRKLKNLLKGNIEDFGALIKEGAQIIDVRSKEEFNGGHIEGSLNIPLQELPRQLIRIKKAKPVIVCCASGVRSSSAKDLLKTQGYKVSNGGSWTSLERKIKTS